MKPDPSAYTLSPSRRKETRIKPGSDKRLFLAKKPTSFHIDNAGATNKTRICNMYREGGKEGRKEGR